MILVCNCKHVFQDKKHGKSRRVHNPCMPLKDNNWRCTVCGTKKPGRAVRIVKE